MAFSSLARTLGGGLTIDYPPATFFDVVCFEVEISSGTQIPLFLLASVHSGSAS